MRIIQLQSISRDTNNTLLVGLPLTSSAPNRQSNGLIAIQHGEIIHEQRKVNPTFYEAKNEHFYYEKSPNYYYSLGKTALICSELIFASTLDDTLREQTTDLLIPAAWSVPTVTPEAVALHESLADYHHDTLNRSATWAARSLPQLTHIYIADRPIAGMPQSGRIHIKR